MSMYTNLLKLGEASHQKKVILLKELQFQFKSPIVALYLFANNLLKVKICCNFTELCHELSA